jgi:hypothetical protein
VAVSPRCLLGDLASIVVGRLLELTVHFTDTLDSTVIGALSIIVIPLVYAFLCLVQSPFTVLSI